MPSQFAMCAADRRTSSSLFLYLRRSQRMQKMQQNARKGKGVKKPMARTTAPRHSAFVARKVNITQLPTHRRTSTSNLGQAS